MSLAAADLASADSPVRHKAVAVPQPVPAVSEHPEVEEEVVRDIGEEGEYVGSTSNAEEARTLRGVKKKPSSGKINVMKKPAAKTPAEKEPGTTPATKRAKTAKTTVQEEPTDEQAVRKRPATTAAAAVATAAATIVDLDAPKYSIKGDELRDATKSKKFLALFAASKLPPAVEAAYNACTASRGQTMRDEQTQIVTRFFSNAQRTGSLWHNHISRYSCVATSTSKKATPTRPMQDAFSKKPSQGLARSKT